MTSVAASAEGRKKFLRRAAFFRNVVIVSSLLASILDAAWPHVAYLVYPTEATEAAKSRYWSTTGYLLVPLLLLAVVQMLPVRAWRWVGLVAYVFSGVAALFLLLGLGSTVREVSSAAWEGYLVPSLVLLPLMMLAAFVAMFISWFCLGRYCRGWAREFASSPTVDAAGTSERDSG